MNNKMDTPIVGILGWEARNNNTLSQFGDIPGDIAHPNTFSFPVLYQRIPGACYETVIVEPNAQVRNWSNHFGMYQSSAFCCCHTAENCVTRFRYCYFGACGV